MTHEQLQRQQLPTNSDTEALRLREHYQSRRQSKRPMPACVAKAYRKLIDERSQAQR